jgi:predicted acetyltransferase
MAHVEIRPARPDEMAEYARQAARQLALPPDMFTGMEADWTMCAIVDGAIATTYAAWPLQIRLNGRAVRIAGVTQVSTHPAHRRRGYLRAVSKRHFEMLHERREVAFAGLHPAWVAIYQRYGYGSVHQRHGYRIAPRDIVFHHPATPAGRLREIDPASEFGVLVDVYRRYRDDRTGLVHRGRAMWDAGALQPPPAGQNRVVLAYAEGADTLGYVAYHHGPSPRPRQLRITDFFALTPAARQALWQALAGYDNVDEIVWDNAPADDPLPLMLAEPRHLNSTVRDGIMARLVTVEDAMAQRPYAAISELRFALADGFCPWNAGSWRIATSPEGGQASRIDGQAVDFTLAPDTLASLVFGRFTATDAAEAGLLEGVQGRAVLERWNEVLRLAHPPHEAEHTW